MLFQWQQTVNFVAHGTIIHKIHYSNKWSCIAWYYGGIGLIIQTSGFIAHSDTKMLGNKASSQANQCRTLCVQHNFIAEYHSLTKGHHWTEHLTSSPKYRVFPLQPPGSLWGPLTPKPSHTEAHSHFTLRVWGSPTLELLPLGIVKLTHSLC